MTRLLEKFKKPIQYSMMAHAGAHIVWKVIWIILL